MIIAMADISTLMDKQNKRVLLEITMQSSLLAIKKEAYKMAKTNKKMYFGKEISDMMKMFD